METSDKIIALLSKGKTQAEISQLLKAANVKPNSLSHIEKHLKKTRKEHNAKTMFHLGVILTTKKLSNVAQ